MVGVTNLKGVFRYRYRSDVILGNCTKSCCCCCCCLKKNQNAPRPSGHPPVRRKNVKTFRWDHRLQIRNLNNTSTNNKDKYNTIIETRTAEDPDDENLHNPETVQDAVIHLEVDEEQ